MLSDSTAAAVLRRLHEDEQVLLGVTGFFWGEGEGARELLVGLMLKFEGSLVCFGVSEEDELLVKALEPEFDSAVTVVALSEREPWKSALQTPLLWSWVMTNQQGYDDGVQLEFARTGADVPVVVQLIAIGAQVGVRQVAAAWMLWDAV